MKRLFFLLMLGVVGALTGCGDLLPNSDSDKHWLTSMTDAKQTANQSDKLILVNFTGSDWCVWCKRLRSEVFVRESFLTYATNRFVLLEVDFPKNRELPAQLKNANEQLRKRYQIEGFPTVLMLDKYGRELARIGYIPGGARAYTAELENLRKGALGEATTANGDIVRAQLRGLPDLQLKGISGSGSARLALINSYTLQEGETTTIKVGPNRHKLKCVEIKDQSVTVAIDGREDRLVELRLSGRL